MMFSALVSLWIQPMSSIYKKSVNSTTARIREDFAAETLNQKRKIMADLKSIYKKLSSKPLDGEELDCNFLRLVKEWGFDSDEFIASLKNPANSASAPES
jgi:hypothetical protein